MGPNYTYKNTKQPVALEGTPNTELQMMRHLEHPIPNGWQSFGDWIQCGLSEPTEEHTTQALGLLWVRVYCSIQKNAMKDISKDQGTAST